jgi:hypothetical protein
MTEALRTAREDLMTAALVLSREVEMNRQVLRSSLSGGTELMWEVCGPADEPATYRSDSRALESVATGGLLIDRQV